MTLQEQQKLLSQKIISSLCHVSDRPEGLLPHIVYVEEEGGDGYPSYVRYHLTDYRSDGICTLQNPDTGISETGRHLSEINTDWLVTLWNRHVESSIEQHLHSVVDEEQVTPDLPHFREGDFVRLTDEAIAEIRRIFGDTAADYRRNMLLQVKYMRQNSADNSWHIGVQGIHEDDVQEFAGNFLRSATADELAERSNDEHFNDTEDYIRFIQMND